MVVIGAGLAAIPREVLEAARTDGATEWQVFRRITVPMLAPVLCVVFITMLINVLKVFDIVISIAPGSTQSDAAVIAVQMWRQSFGGVNDFGLGSAIAVFLFLLVDPGAAPERAPLPEGGLMATYEAEAAPVVVSDPSDRVAARIGRAVAHGCRSHLFLLVRRRALARADDRPLPHVAALAGRLRDERLVEGLLQAEPRDVGELLERLEQHGHPDVAAASTAEIAIGGTVLPIIIAALAGYAFAWIDFPGRDWLFVVVIALLVVPLQMALIPIFTLYNTVGIFDTVFSLILFHTAFGLPFAIFLLRNFFIGIPEGHPRVGAHRRRVGDPHLPEADPAARPAGDRVARDLPVPLDVERPARRARDGAEHAADHRRDLQPAAAVRLEHRHHRAGVVHLDGHPARRCSSRSSATSRRACWPAR